MLSLVEDGAGGRGRFEMGVEAVVVTLARAEERPQVLGRAGAQEVWTMMPQSRQLRAAVRILTVS